LVKELKKQVNKLHDKFDDMKTSIKRFERDAEDKIRENPVKSVLVAAGIGAIAGAIISALLGRKR